MKKIISLVIVMLFVCSTVQAGVLDNVVNFIAKHPMKTGIYYDLVDQEAKGVIGTTVKSGFIYSKVDLDLMVSAPNDDIFNVDLANYQTVLGGLSYNIPISTNSALSLGLDVGLDRIEKVTNTKEIGEFKYGVTVAWKFKI